jgi:hypothetical protein
MCDCIIGHDVPSSNPADSQHASSPVQVDENLNGQVKWLLRTLAPHNSPPRRAPSPRHSSREINRQKEDHAHLQSRRDLVVRDGKRTKATQSNVLSHASTASPINYVVGNLIHPSHTILCSKDCVRLSDRLSYPQKDFGTWRFLPVDYRPAESSLRHSNIRLAHSLGLLRYQVQYKPCHCSKSEDPTPPTLPHLPDCHSKYLMRRLGIPAVGTPTSNSSILRCPSYSPRPFNLMDLCALYCTCHYSDRIQCRKPSVEGMTLRPDLSCSA